MLIATSLAAALYASHAFAASGTAPGITAFTSVPPMIVDVVSAPDISASLVSSVLAETDAVWRGSGFTFVWRRATREVDPYASGNEAGPYPAATLRVVIGNETRPMRDGRLPLGQLPEGLEKRLAQREALRPGGAGPGVFHQFPLLA